MKKKIKLEAWRIGEEIYFFIEDKGPKNTPSYMRDPDYDIEKEIEVPDEVKKPREWWIEESNSLKLDQAWSFESKQGLIHAQEVLPGHMQIDRKKIKTEWPLGLHENYFQVFCNKLGLPEWGK